MAEHDYIELDYQGGYKICEKRTTVDTDQGEVKTVSFVALRPPPEQEVARAKTLADLREQVDAMQQSFAEVDGYILEFTHDPQPRDATNVNVFDLDGDHLCSGNFPKDGGKKELFDILPPDLVAKGPDVADALHTLRTRPKPRQEDHA